MQLFINQASVEKYTKCKISETNKTTKPEEKTSNYLVQVDNSSNNKQNKVRSMGENYQMKTKK